MENLKIYVIQMVRELGITYDELGFPKEKDEQLIHEVSQMIHEMDIENAARENISEKYWEDLAIVPQKKYQLVEVTLKKTIYKKVKVAVPENADEITDIDYDYVDNDYLCDEDDWEVDEYNMVEKGMIADEIRDRYDSYDVVNIDDFDCE